MLVIIRWLFYVCMYYFFCDAPNISQHLFLKKDYVWELTQSVFQKGQKPLSVRFFFLRINVFNFNVGLAILLNNLLYWKGDIFVFIFFNTLHISFSNKTAPFLTNLFFADGDYIFLVGTSSENT